MQNIINIQKQIEETLSSYDLNSEHGIKTVVYDMDDTLIDRYGRPIVPIINSLHYAINKGFYPVIITARVANQKTIAMTNYQLKQLGLNIPIIYFRPFHKQDFQDFKMKSRKDLHNKGHKVIISVGDQLWDMGFYGGKGFLIK